MMIRSSLLGIGLAWLLVPKAAEAQCMVSADPTAAMGSFSSASFTGIGSSVGQRPFSISLQGCSTGMGSVSYSLHPVSGSVGGAASGIAQLSPGPGAATGIGLRITDAAGAPVAFDADHMFAGYNSAVGGNYQIFFHAAYYQTGALVGPGSADAQIEFTITYQ